MYAGLVRHLFCRGRLLLRLVLEIRPQYTLADDRVGAVWVLLDVELLEQGFRARHPHCAQRRVRTVGRQNVFAVEGGAGGR